MAGASVKLTVNDTGVTRALGRLAGQEGSLVTACLKNIGEALIKSVHKHFAEQKTWDGKPFAPLNPEYAKGKKNPKILRESGGLEASYVYRVSGSQVQVGSNKVQAAAMHFGATIVPKTADALVFRLNGRIVHAKKVTIPARPVLGVSAADKTTITEIVEDHINEAWNGG